MERELSLELVRVTEMAAIASAGWVGRGDKNSADNAATSAIRAMFDTVSIRGTVVIGEGEMDEAPMLYIGESVGNRQGPEVDVAVDPVEGTDSVAKGSDNAIAVIAMAPKGQLLHAPDIYMDKLACGPSLAGKLSLDDPISVTINKATAALGKGPSELTVMILDRERHQPIVDELRRLGVRISFIDHGDVSAAIATALPICGVDLYMGSGGAPEGVLAAAALRCLGGELQGRLLPQTPEELKRTREMGIEDPTKVLTMEEMVGDDDVMFSATGITSGALLDGVKYLPGKQAETYSIVMRAKTQTVRFIRTLHCLPQKPYLQKS